MNHPFRSMLGFLSNTQQLALIIYDINRDDIVRFVTNPDVELLENHYKNFKPFSRSSGAGYDEYDQSGRPYFPMYSRRFGSGGRAPVSINVGGEQGVSPQEMVAPKPDDDMVDSAVKRVRE